MLSLPGRGIDLTLALTYNSRLWHKAGNEITYDIDRDWPAPGWSLGFGKIVSMGTSQGFMIIEPDGTRHGYTGTLIQNATIQSFTGRTTDGTFIDYTVSAWAPQYGNGPIYATVQLSDGTVINYGAEANWAIYPTRITDPNGNFVTITYLDNKGPEIASYK